MFHLIPITQRGRYSEMKKIPFIAILLFLLLSIVFLFYLFSRNRPLVIMDFCVSDYRSYIEAFPSSQNVGKILDEKDVLKKAESVWVSMFGESVKRERPYSVFYDNQNDVWLVMSLAPTNMNQKGGSAFIIIQTNGTVLAVWHEE